MNPVFLHIIRTIRFAPFVLLCGFLLLSAPGTSEAQTGSDPLYYPLLLPVEVSDRLEGDSLHVSERLSGDDGFLTLLLPDTRQVSTEQLLARLASGEIHFGGLHLNLQTAEVLDDSTLRIPYSIASGEDTDYVRSRVEFSRSAPVRGAGMTLNIFTMQENRLELHLVEETSTVHREIEQHQFPNPYSRLNFFVNSDSVDVRIERPGRPDRVFNTGTARHYSSVNLQGPARVSISSGGSREELIEISMQPGETRHMEVDTRALEPGLPGFYHRNRTWIWTGLSVAMVSTAAVLLTGSSGTDTTVLPPPPGRPQP